MNRKEAGQSVVQMPVGRNRKRRRRWEEEKKRRQEKTEVSLAAAFGVRGIATGLQKSSKSRTGSEVLTTYFLLEDINNFHEFYSR